MNKKVFFSLVTVMLCVVCLWMVVSKGSIKIAEDEVPLANSAQQKSPDEATDSLTDDDVVKVRLQGHCVGCPGARMTLSHVVHQIIFESCPTLKGVEAVD